MNRRSSLLWIVLSALLLVAPALRAQDGLRGALSQSAEHGRVLFAFAQDVAAADFDNDQKPDGAVLLQGGPINREMAFRIELHLTGQQNATIRFSSSEAHLAITSVDVNRDGAPDILIERALTHQRLQVYLNDGHGAFQRSTSETPPPPGDSDPLWSMRVIDQELPSLFLPTTRGFEIARVETAAAWRESDTNHVRLWHEALLVQCGARAPSASRAPPSFPSL